MVSSFKVLDLFSGTGGFSLGLERTGGFKTVAFCEIDEFCRQVLNRHWPDIPIYEDVCGLTADVLAADGIYPDVITGGFPCQDISLAGKGAGLSGERSRLWWQFHRLIAEIGPQWVIIENVAALRHRGLDAVLRCLAQIGYDAEWHCIPASAIGALHRRDRVWIVAHPASQPKPEPRHETETIGDQRNARVELGRSRARQLEREPCQDMAKASGLFGRDEFGDQPGRVLSGDGLRTILDDRGSGRSWIFEPDVGRVADGVPSRVGRLRALGNALVPQIPQMIGTAILSLARSVHEHKPLDQQT